MAAESAGYPVMEVVEQDWSEPTGRLTLDWKPDLAFTDECLLYVSLARGYKSGGFTIVAPYDPETLTAYEIGSKNRFLADALQLPRIDVVEHVQPAQIRTWQVEGAVNRLRTKDRATDAADNQFAA